MRTLGELAVAVEGPIMDPTRLWISCQRPGQAGEALLPPREGDGGPRQARRTLEESWRLALLCASARVTRTAAMVDGDAVSSASCEALRDS